MTIPKVIPIDREEDFHTDKLGTYEEDNQYVGFVFFLETHQRRLVSVLHRFDLAGKHIGSNAWDSEAGSDVESELDNAIAALPNAKPNDVKIKPFSVEFFGRTFGLIKIDDNRVDYEPYGLAFFPPWDGLYDT